MRAYADFMVTGLDFKNLADFVEGQRQYFNRITPIGVGSSPVSIGGTIRRRLFEDSSMASWADDIARRLSASFAGPENPRDAYLQRRR